MSRSALFISLAVFLTAAKCEKRVNVATAEDLEKATANPQLAGFELVLAPGTYKIRKTLALQDGQRLRGANEYVDHDGDGVWDPIDPAADERDPAAAYASNETIIDGSERQGSEIIILNGSNTIEGLTLRGAGKAPESADVFGDMRYFVKLATQAAPGTATVKNCLMEHGYHALGFGSSATGTFSAEATGNIVREMVEAIVAGGDGASDATFNVTLSYNRFTGKPFDATAIGDFGWAINNSSSSRCTINLTSQHNITDSWSQIGVSMAAGFVLTPASAGDPPRLAASDNVINWTSTGDAFWRNGNGQVFGSGGALNLTASQDLGTATAMPSNNNTLNVILRDTRFVRPGTAFWEQNLAYGIGRQDIGAAGANRPNCGVRTANNVLNLDIRGATTDNTSPDNTCLLGFCGSVFAFGNDHPGDASNVVNLVPADLASENTGFAPAITGPFFLPECPQ